jgi:hypothetical protein
MNRKLLAVLLLLIAASKTNANTVKPLEVDIPRTVIICTQDKGCIPVIIIGE